MKILKRNIMCVCILFVAISMSIRYYYELEGALAVTDENKAEKEGATAAATYDRILQFFALKLTHSNHFPFTDVAHQLCRENHDCPSQNNIIELILLRSWRCTTSRVSSSMWFYSQFLLSTPVPWTTPEMDKVFCLNEKSRFSLDFGFQCQVSITFVISRTCLI